MTDTPFPRSAVQFLYDLGGDPDEALWKRREGRLAALLVEAAADERERIALAMEGLHPKHDDWWCECGERLPEVGICSRLAAVLAVVEGK
jgi:hypothetical protein